MVPKSPKKLDDNIAVWAEFNEIGRKYGCLSLGEGAPGYQPPKFLRDHMIEAIDDGHNQYCRTFGHPLLIEKIASCYGPKFKRNIDP